jgi:hypothetical protein
VSATRDIVIGLLTSVPKDALALRLSEELSMEFRMRESSYYGGLYFTTRQPQQPLGSEEIFVFANVAPSGDPEYPEAPECPLLVEFRNSSRLAPDALALVTRLSGVECRIVRS